MCRTKKFSEELEEGIELFWLSWQLVSIIGSCAFPPVRARLGKMRRQTIANWSSTGKALNGLRYPGELRAVELADLSADQSQVFKAVQQQRQPNQSQNNFTCRRR